MPGLLKALRESPRRARRPSQQGERATSAHGGGALNALFLLRAPLERTSTRRPEASCAR